mmetsp:Transcript_54085/g.152041  ORF Transcript_54085/g.152041 Transcript_54085/m.152041 type:complete len:236 (+) Transcript_54085:453-1160(+)
MAVVRRHLGRAREADHLHPRGEGAGAMAVDGAHPHLVLRAGVQRGQHALPDAAVAPRRGARESPGARRQQHLDGVAIAVAQQLALAPGGHAAARGEVLVDGAALAVPLELHVGDGVPVVVGQPELTAQGVHLRLEHHRWEALLGDRAWRAQAAQSQGPLAVALAVASPHGHRELHAADEALEGVPRVRPILRCLDGGELFRHQLRLEQGVPLIRQRGHDRANLRVSHRRLQLLHG